jgi:hypothetical protein
MTVLHLVRLAALEHTRRNGATDGHIFFELVRIHRQFCVIQFSMGS